jgi:undecaprenyl-diphosphatase
MNTLLQLDTKLFYVINHTLANWLFDILMPIITNQKVWLIPLVLLCLGLVIWGKRRARLAVLIALLSVGSADLICAQLLKPLVQRPRPSHVLADVRLLVGKGGRRSFPSNHAANITAAMAVLIYFYRRYQYTFGAVALLVSFSRIYVGVHYPLDVLAGIGIGVLCSLAWIKLWRLGALKIHWLQLPA